MKITAFILTLTLGLTSAVFAWSTTGHMIIASMAYRQLPAQLRAAYTDLLEHHPEAASWKADYDSDSGGLQWGEYLFMRAGLWADEIRRERDHPHDHPTWHYTNYPLRPDQFPLEDTLTPDNDVRFGIEQSRLVLEDSGVGAELKAVHLSWLLHLIADLHQPLHAVALVNDQFPEGDRGGNSIFIRPAEQGIRLHSFWDGLLGRSFDVRQAHQDMLQLEDRYARDVLTELDAARMPEQWALESRRIAIESVYLHGFLPMGTDQDSAPSIPPTYGQSSKRIAERRAALAAFRLSDVLIKIAER